MKKTAKRIWKSGIAFLFLAFSNVAHGNGVTVDVPDGPKVDNPLGFDSLYEFIRAIVETIIFIGIPISVFFIIYAGFLFVTARGNEQQLSKAKQALTWALVGAAVLLGAWVLAEAVEGTIGNLRN